MAKEYLEDITDSDHLGLKWGDRFRCWYETMVFIRSEQVSLGVDDLTYQLKIFLYQYRWIMPARLEFYKGIGEGGEIKYGILSYDEPERLFGVFRFPVDKKGFFESPLSMKKIQQDISKMSVEDMKDLLKTKKVLTFESYKIPYHEFEFFKISEGDFEVIKKMAGEKITSELRSTYNEWMGEYLNSIKKRILSLPNFLLILQNVLDLKYKNEDEIASMTNGIIHFGV